VEFLGLPGVGKSTVCRRAAALLRQRGLTVTEPLRALDDRSGLRVTLRGYRGKALGALHELLEQPRSAVRDLGAIAGTGQPSPNVLARIQLNWLVKRSLLRRLAETPGIHLFDEGLFQALWSIALEGRPGTVHRAGRLLAMCASSADVVAVLEADAADIVRRVLLRRGRESRVDRWVVTKPDSLARACELMGEVLEFLAEVSRGQERPLVVQVAKGSCGGPETIARGAAAEIARVWEYGRPGFRPGPIARPGRSEPTMPAFHGGGP
jgi:hypothetical protein